MTAGLSIQYTGDDFYEEDESTEEVSHLAAVPPTGVTAPTVQVPTNVPSAGLREFEKAQVARTEIKVSGATAINTNDGLEISLDDRIRVVGVFRVTKITHHVTKEGDVVRTQYVAPVEDLELTPFDPMDPNDDGVVRVRGGKP